MLTVEDHGNIAVLRIDHGKVNELDAELLRALVERLEELTAADPDAVVLTGRGNVFSAGADLFRVRDEGPEYVASAVPWLGAAFRGLFAFPRPVVAAVNGHAIAGGCILVCAGDRRIMARGGTIGLGELRVGVPFPTAALEVARFALPWRYFQEIVYFAESYSADEAARLGLVDEVVESDELLPCALAAAERLATIPRDSFRQTKLAIRGPTLERIDRAGPELDREVLRIWSSPEMRAHIAGFLRELFGEQTR